MTAAILFALGLGALASGILVGRYYVPDNRTLLRTARHARSYVRTINLLLERDRDAAVDELVGVVAENVVDVEPYFALGALFRNRGEWERAIRVHQGIELREQSDREVCHRARYQLGLDFRAAGMPRRATQAMEDCLEQDPRSVAALRCLCSLYEEQGRYAESAEAIARIQKVDGMGDLQREHHLLCAAAQRSIEADDLNSAKSHLKAASRIDKKSAHLLVVSAELAASKNNWQAAATNLRQALGRSPDLVSYLAGPLRAAELEMCSEGEEDAATRGAALALAEVHNNVTGDPLLALASVELLAEMSGEQGLEALREISAAHPSLLPARVASARLALASGNSTLVHQELAALVGEDGVLDSALGGTWQCETCGHRTELFSWRCESCRQWGTQGVDIGRLSRSPSGQRRERRIASRTGYIGAGGGLPRRSLDSGLSTSEMARSGRRPSLLGKAAGLLRGALGSVGGRSRDDAPDSETR